MYGSSIALACDTPDLWRGAAGLCARVHACADAAESLHTYIHSTALVVVIVVVVIVVNVVVVVVVIVVVVVERSSSSSNSRIV